MAYYNNNIQIPMMLSMPSSGHSESAMIDMSYSGYFDGLSFHFSNPLGPSPHSPSVNQGSSNSSLISIRRDSGFANSSLDELSTEIMSARVDPTPIQSNGSFSSLNSTSYSCNDSSSRGSNSSFLPPVPSSSTTKVHVERSTPIVPSMSNNGVDYLLNDVQRMYLAQHQQRQQQQQPVVGASSPSTHCTAYSLIGSQGPSAVGSNQSPSLASGTWNIASAASQLSEFPSSGDASSTQGVYTHNSAMGSVYGMQHQQQQQPQQPLLSPLQYHPRQGYLHHARQRKPELHIMTDSEPGQQLSLFPANVNVLTSELTANTVRWEPSSCDMSQNQQQRQPAPGTSPSISTANNFVQSGQQGGYSWGLVSSPVESSLSSGSSTPMFASPSSSYAHSELAASCESSRAASPSYMHLGAYDSCLSERRLKRMEADGRSSSSSLIIRSRKSSTSSTSSMGSQRRSSSLRESCSGISTGPSSPRLRCQITSTSSPTHQCPKCGQNFAGPAVLVRHIESIHDKLLWNCVGCKSNLSRRDAVTRHINLSPMDSICRAVGTIGQVKTSNGVEVHYEVSSYRAKPLDEVMSRMGKKISTALRKEIERSKAELQMREATAATSTSLSATMAAVPTSVTATTAAVVMSHLGCHAMPIIEVNNNNDQTMMMGAAFDDMEMYSEDEGETLEDGLNRKRRRSLMADTDALGRKKK
ncbi:hypothetical protein BGZ98_005757 [Dissophora globulifera]|nr:hypothetical protein BGZ98_005757 [Dissophora globulifera]